MNDTETLDLVTREMLEFDKGDPMRIHHLLKVHRFAQLIARQEALDDHTRFVTECAAIVHDIGIHPAEAKYGRCDGKLQEQEGPAPARDLVGHHHTYENIDGMDYQILVEADFLVNFYEDQLPAEAIRTAREKIFRTAAGRELCALLYGV